MSAKKGRAPKPPSVEERRRAATILKRLAKAYPDWGPTLRFSNPFELLVATILAAQASDESVNRVTSDLFKKYPDPHAYVNAPQAELERDVHSLGFFRQKAKAVKAMSAGVLERFGGVVPRDVEPLTELRGVGRKTASIVVGAAYGTPSIGVDRHVARVSQRLGFTRQGDPDKIELDVAARFNKKDWVKATWCLVLHGRRICTPTPRCYECPVRDLCPYPHKTKAPAEVRGRARVPA
jgi:endonuclease-3